MKNKTRLTALIVIALSLAATGCIVPNDSNYVSRPDCIQFPIIVMMDGYCYVLSGNGDIDLRREDGQVFHGEWDLISNDSGCTSFRIDFGDIDVYPATLTIFGGGSAEIWLTQMNNRIYGTWY